MDVDSAERADAIVFVVVVVLATVSFLFFLGRFVAFASSTEGPGGDG